MTHVDSEGSSLSALSAAAVASVWYQQAVTKLVPLSSNLLPATDTQSSP